MHEIIEHTPSMEDGLHLEVENSARAVGCHWVLQMANSLNLPPATIATGCMLLQRFYWTKSLLQHHPHFMAAACLSLSCELEETNKPSKHIILAYLAGCSMHRGEPACSITLKELIDLQKALAQKVRLIKKSIGFSLLVRSPLRILEFYVRSMNLGHAHEEAKERAENILKDSLFTDMCVRFPTEEIALACVLLATEEMKMSMLPYPIDIKEVDVVTIADEIRQLKMNIDISEDHVLVALQEGYERKARRTVECFKENRSKGAEKPSTQSESDSDSEEPEGTIHTPIGFKSVPMEDIHASNQLSQVPTQLSQVPTKRPQAIPGRIRMIFQSPTPPQEEQDQDSTPAQHTYKRPRDPAVNDDVPAKKRQRMST